MNGKEFLDRLEDGALSRRRFSRMLAGAGLAMVTLPVVGPAHAAGEDLVYLTWTGYDDPGFHPKYVEKHGKSPTSTIFADEQEALTKMRGGFQADVSHPCNQSIARWRDAGVIQPLDPARLSNWGDLFGPLKSITGAYADGKQWFVPVDWGNTSVVYRTDLVDIQEESWTLLWDKRYAGKLSIGEDVTDTALIAAILIGAKDPFNMTDAEIEKVKAKLLEQKPLLRFYWSDNTAMEQALATGELVASSSWNSSAATLQDQGVPVKYANPKEGIISYCCGLVLCAGATHVDLAYDLMDAMIDPTAGKWLVETQGYGHSNKKTFELVSDDILKKRGLPKDPTEMFSKSVFAAPNLRIDDLQAMFDSVRAAL